MESKATNGTIGNRLKKYRVARMWTWEQLGAACGLTGPAVWKIAHEKVQPNELTIAKLRRALPGLLDDEAA